MHANDEFAIKKRCPCSVHVGKPFAVIVLSKGVDKPRRNASVIVFQPERMLRDVGLLAN